MKTTIYISIANFLFLFCSLSEVKAQNVGINGSGATAHASALLDLDDVAGGNNKGLLIPRIPLTAINAAAPVTSPATSLLVYNTASASSGTNAVSPGYYYWDGTKWIRFAYTASGSSSTAWDLLGNAGTNSTTNFLGTTDNVDLVFKRNNVRAGLINTSNTSFGNGALNPSSSAVWNTAFGVSALAANTTGNNNTAVGAQALGATTSGSGNTVVGERCMQNNLTGGSNVGMGQMTLLLNTSGSGNVALGSQAMSNNTNGNSNVAIGAGAL